MKGALKTFSYENGYGWIRVGGRDADLFFHISQYKDADELRPGTNLIFEIGRGPTGREQAVQVRLDQQAPAKTTANTPPYRGRPTYALSTSFWSSVARGRKIESKCMQCGGPGNVTAIDRNKIGFQCERCLRYWREPNRSDDWIDPKNVFWEDDDKCPQCGSWAMSGYGDKDGLEFRCGRSFFHKWKVKSRG